MQIMDDDKESGIDQGKQKKEWYLFNDGARIISYNLNESERPSGVKIRFKVRIVSGREAAAADQRQAEAVKEYLKWVRQYRSRSTGHTGTGSGTPPPP